jgi:hypothetical protein
LKPCADAETGLLQRIKSCGGPVCYFFRQKDNLRKKRNIHLAPALKIEMFCVILYVEQQ